MKKLSTRAVAVTTTALLVLSACGGGSTSSRSRNSVLATGPCVSVTGESQDVVDVRFCAGAVTFSTDNGETTSAVPKKLQITADKWPAAEGKTSKVSIMSYDQAGTLIGDDVVTRTVKNDCESGSYCTTGETGPNGGSVVVSKSNENFYYEIMPTNGKFVTKDRISASEAAAASIQAPWQLPTVTELSDILNSTDGESISDSRLANYKFEEDVSLWCEKHQQKYCFFHPFWTTNYDERFARSTVPASSLTALEQIKTIGFDLDDYKGDDSIKLFCPLSDMSASAGCLATLLPVRVYSPEKPTTAIAVEQVDRDRWQELCTGAPEVAIGENSADKDFSITVSHPCIATASKEQSIGLAFKVLRIAGDGNSEVVADLANEVSDEATQINIEVPGDGSKVFRYNLPEGNYVVKTRILFPRVGDLDTSDTAYAEFAVGGTPFKCQPAEVFLKENELTTTCEGATGMALQYVYGVDTEPRVIKQSESVELEIPNGWHLFELIVFSKTSQAGIQMWGCLKDCGPKAVDGLTVTAIREDAAIVSTSRLTCEEGNYTLIGQGSPNGNPNLLWYVGPTQEITSADQVIAKPASGIYMYTVKSCKFEEGRAPEFGLVFVETLSASANAPTLPNDLIARTEVIDIDRNNGEPVIAPATNTTMEIVMGDMKDVVSLSISMDGATTNLSAGAPPTLVNIPRGATSMKITTKKMNGAVEVFTKVISRPAQLPTAASAAPTSQGTSGNSRLWILLLLLVIILLIIARIKYRKPKESQ
jgi:hypothetical protein